jgi:hypothetical protein
MVNKLTLKVNVISMTIANQLISRNENCGVSGSNMEEPFGAYASFRVDTHLDTNAMHGRIV